MFALALIASPAAAEWSWFGFRSGPAKSATRGKQDSAAAAVAIQRLMGQAREQVRLGRIDDAEDTLEDLIARYPSAPEAATARSMLLDLYDRHETASAAPQKLPKSAVDAHNGAPSSAPGRRQHSADNLNVAVGDRVFFDSGSAALGPNERAVISGQANWLIGRPDAVVTIQSHADDPGSEQRNRSLSIARAEAVRSLLLTLGVPAERIRLRPEGNALPVARCGASVRDREICAAQNRRAVSVVTWIDEASTAGGATGRAGERSSDAGIPARNGTARAPVDR